MANKADRQESEGDLDKWQVALKKVHPRHGSPPRFPDQLELHVERKNVVPNIYRSGNDYAKNQKGSTAPPMAELTLKILMEPL